MRPPAIRKPAVPPPARNALSAPRPPAPAAAPRAVQARPAAPPRPAVPPVYRPAAAVQMYTAKNSKEEKAISALRRRYVAAYDDDWYGQKFDEYKDAAATMKAIEDFVE